VAGGELKLMSMHASQNRRF